MDFVIIEIKKPIEKIDKSNIKFFCKKFAKFCREYHDVWIIIVPEKVVLYGYAEIILINFYSFDYDIKIEKLNKFALNRLISNLEKEYPEISLILLGAGENSKLMTITRRRKNAE